MNQTALPWVERVWVARTPLGPTPAPGSRILPWDGIGAAIAWPLALLLTVHRVFILALRGSITDDFSTVYAAVQRFTQGVPVYNEIYHHVDPHYLYSPGATLLLSPLAWAPSFGLARLAFIFTNALAVIIALAILTRISGFRLNGVVWPASIALAMLTESVRNTLVFSNINGILLLALAAFLWLFLNEKQWLAGIVLGIAILVKPQFLPLLFLPLIKLQWRPVIGALMIPAGMNAIAWNLVVDAHDYLTKLLPYLGEIRDYANSSLPGFALYFGMPEKWLLLIMAVLGSIGCLGGILLLRWRYTDPALWALSTSGLLFSGVFLFSSLGQMYYSMLLFPWIFTMFWQRSVFHQPLAWVAAFLFFFPEDWMSPKYFPEWGKWLSYFSATAGWALIISVAAGSALGWYFTQQRRYRNPVAGV
ncbi:glycosyltransferase family 87 protein [Corynebacterium caspium]|uniref:glycosyltransferase family 87 protein n=1 Tax=Corynebacterium caspium TaxID=234828 RepID=UPI0003A5C2E6|nr:glycosyltransferase family 87 protein [Corynebacterium caspium]WKD59163.1 Alpha-(1->3)-arabinofuranosyltransferase [Corynebacterium caspium DSM 44850]